MKIKKPVNEEAIRIGKCIKLWRISRGMTQLELAVSAGVSKSTLSQIERVSNDAPPKPVTLGRLAKALNISMSLLLDEPMVDNAKTSIDCVTQAETHDVVRIDRINRDDDDLCCEVDGQSPRYIVVPSTWINDTENLRQVIVPDSSMAPSGLRKGDVAIIRLTTSPSPGVWALCMDGMQMIRRVVPLTSDCLRISCDNERYGAPVVVARDTVRLIAKVAYTVRCEIPD